MAAIFFTLCAAARVAGAAGGEPLTVALLLLPGEEAPGLQATPSREAPTATTPALAAQTPEAHPGKQPDDTSWGLLVRGGYFGLPNFIADELFFKHPTVEGSSIGAEIRYHGEDGGRGTASIGLAVDSATASADGEWQQQKEDDPQQVHGNMSVLAITLTGYWSLFPSWYVHPYAGIGIGVAHVQGHYEDKDEIVEADIWIPAVHVPVGLAVELGERLQFAIEGRFIDGIAIGGALQVRF